VRINSVDSSHHLQDARKLRKAVEEFVGLVFSDVFKKLDRSIPKSNLIPETPAQRWFKDMLYEEYSRKMVSLHFSNLVDLIMKDLALKNYRK